MIPNVIKFWILLIVLVPSTIVSLFVLYHLFSKRTLRTALSNHVIMLLLCIGLLCQVTDYPWTLFYYRAENASNRSLTFCLISVFLHWALYVTQTILFAWATVERHILVFHDRWVSTQRSRFLFHFLPIVILLLYCLIYYFIVIFLPPCQNSVYHSSLQCARLFLFSSYQFRAYETTAHQLVPIFIIVVFSGLLIVRIAWRKHRIHRPIQWRRHRTMLVQLLSISLVYLIFALPLTFAYMLISYSTPSNIIVELFDFCLFLSYFILLFLPFVCVLSLPEIRNEINKIRRLYRLINAMVPVP